MRTFFITNRNYTGEKGRHFGHKFQEDSDWFRVGWADVDDHTLADDLPKIDDLHISPERYSEDRLTGRFRFTRVGSDEMFPELVAALRAGAAGADGADRPPVAGFVFVPGFNYNFVESIARAAHLAHLYSIAPTRHVPLVFSWPSDGVLSTAAYKSDRDDAEKSGRAMARAFALFLSRIRKLAQSERCGAPLHLLAHSMGVLALRHAVATLEQPNFPAWPAAIFDSAILAAGDDNRDTLEVAGKLGAIVRLANRIDVYINSNDKPLRLGDDVDGEFERLGVYGPHESALPDRFAKPLSIVDCRHVDYWGKDPSRHQYYRVSPVVIDDIKEVLAGVAPMDATHRKARFDSVTQRYVLRH